MAGFHRIRLYIDVSLRWDRGRIIKMMQQIHHPFWPFLYDSYCIADQTVSWCSVLKRIEIFDYPSR